MHLHFYKDTTVFSQLCRFAKTTWQPPPHIFDTNPPARTTLLALLTKFATR